MDVAHCPRVLANIKNLFSEKMQKKNMSEDLSQEGMLPMVVEAIL